MIMITTEVEIVLEGYCETQSYVGSQERLNWRNQAMQGWSLETSSLYESSKATVLEASVTNITWICNGV